MSSLQLRLNKVGPIDTTEPPEDTSSPLPPNGHKGVSLTNVQTVEDLRQLPCPLAVKKEHYIRRRNRFAEGSTPDSNPKNSISAKSRFVHNHWSNISYSLTPWNRTLKTIEGKHGAGVASYFQFLRWIFGLNLLLFLLLFSFVVLPMAIGEEVALTFSDNPVLNSSANCSSNYTVEIGSGLDLLLSALDGTGWLEKTPLFYGHYAVQLDHGYNLPVSYVMSVLTCLMVSLFLMVRYTACSFKETLQKSMNARLAGFMQVFIGWDFAVSNNETKELKHLEMYKNLETIANEKKDTNARQARFRSQLFVCRLYVTRIVVNVTVAASLAGAAYLIYYVTAYSTEFGQVNKTGSGTNSWLLLLVNYLPSITITVLCAVLPLAYELLVLLEDYSGHVVVKVTLIRTVVLRLASLVVLCITLYTQISCGSKDDCGVSTSPSCTHIKCWETNVGQQFYKLVIVDFLAIVLLVFLVELPRRFLSLKCKWWIIQKFGPAEFNIAANVLDLIYGQCLVWLGMLFSPLLPGIVVVKYFIVFYTKKLSALVACPPVKAPYQASGINRFFMMVLMLAFALCYLPVLYSIFGFQPSRGCGPFRVHRYMHECIHLATLSVPSVLSMSYNFVTSIAVTGTVIIALLVAIYYTSYVTSAHRENAKYYRKQLLKNVNTKEKFPQGMGLKPSTAQLSLNASKEF